MQKCTDGSHISTKRYKLPTSRQHAHRLKSYGSVRSVGAYRYPVQMYPGYKLYTVGTNCTYTYRCPGSLVCIRGMHTIVLPESWVLDTFWRESEAVPECPDTCTRIPVPGIWVCMYSDTGTGVPVYPGTGYVAFFIATMLDLCIQLYRVLPESWVLDTFGRESDVCPAGCACYVHHRLW